MATFVLMHSMQLQGDGKIHMKDYGKILTVGVVAIFLRFLLLPDSITTAATGDMPIEKTVTLNMIMQFLIRNRLWLYIGMMVYLICFARRNSSKQLMSSFQYDVGLMLRIIILALGFCVVGVSVLFIFSFLK